MHCSVQKILVLESIACQAEASGRAWFSKESAQQKEKAMSSSNASTSAKQAKDDMRSMAQDVKAAAQGAVEGAAHRVQQLGSDVKHAVQDRLEGVQSRAAEYYGQGREKLHDLNQSLEHRVRAQPLTYLLVAGSVGFALGFLLTKRR
jgi:ElaB/YqjD/DUF883 family membrane-anchored ribosome-binding protein